MREQVKRSEEARLQAETEARDAHRRMLSAKQAFTRALQEKDEEVKRVRAWHCLPTPHRRIRADGWAL